MWSRDASWAWIDQGAVAGALPISTVYRCYQQWPPTVSLETRERKRFSAFHIPGIEGLRIA
jgi:hypothetical protein